jgi:hypothetical protein
MQFAISKYTLTHFTRRRDVNIYVLVRLQGLLVKPKPVVQVLGLQLDSKLCWTAYEQATQRKISTQMLALQRTTALT